MAWRRRKTVIALRLGMPLSFSPLGETFTADLNHGDLYIMERSSNILYVTLSTRGRRVPYTAAVASVSNDHPVVSQK